MRISKQQVVSVHGDSVKVSVVTPVLASTKRECKYSTGIQGIFKIRKI